MNKPADLIGLLAFFMAAHGHGASPEEDASKSFHDTQCATVLA
jgi:hypothetical protein